MTEVEEINEYVLHLEFDLQQISTSLRYDITRYDSKHHDISHCRESVLQRTGKFAGAYHLGRNAKIYVNIKATYTWEIKKNNLPEKLDIAIDPGFTIVDLVFVSAPAGNSRQSALSLFDKESAGNIFRNWQLNGSPEVKIVPGKEPQNEEEAIATFSVHPQVFEVVDDNASWQLSGYLSIQQNNLETLKPVTRVYIFDPTVVVGTGGDEW